MIQFSINSNSNNSNTSETTTSQSKIQTEESPNFLISQHFSSNPKPKLPPYISASPKQIVDIDYFPINFIVQECGKNVPWTDLFFHLIAKGDKKKLKKFISLFSKKAQEIGEELIDAFLAKKFDYLEHLVVVDDDRGEISFFKSNILFKFSTNDDNSFSETSQQLKVINYLVNEKSLNRLFALPCTSLITKHGIRICASSLFPSESSDSSTTSNNILKLISQTLNLRSPSICGRLGTDKTFYLVDFIHLFPFESKNQQRKSVFLHPDLIRSHSKPIDEQNIQILTNSIYSTLIPQLSRSIQNGKIKINQCFEIKSILHKRMLCLHHLPILIDNILLNSEIHEQDELKICDFSETSQKSMNFLVVELFSRILKWRFYSFNGYLVSKLEKTNELRNQFFFSKLKDRLEHWRNLWKNYFSMRVTVQFDKSLSSNFDEKYSTFWERDGFWEDVSNRFSQLCGSYGSKNCFLKTIEISNPTFEELIELRKEREFNFGKDSLTLISILLQIAQVLKLQKSPTLTLVDQQQIFQIYQECLRICKQNEKQNILHFFQIQLESMHFKTWSSDSLFSFLQIKWGFEKLTGKQHPTIYATLLSEIGEILEKHEKHSEALKYFEESLKIQKQTNNFHLSYSVTLNNIALAFKKMQNLDQSLKFFEECLKFEEQLIGTQHLSYATTLTQIGMILKEKGHLEKSLACLKDSLKIRNQSPTIGKQNFSFSETLYLVGEILIKQEKFEEALTYLKDSLKIYEQTISSENQTMIEKQQFEHSKILGKIALSLNHLQRYEEALIYYEKCLKSYEQSISIGKQQQQQQQQHPDYAMTLRNCAIILMFQRKFDESFKYFEKCLKIQKDPIELAHTLSTVAYFFRIQGKFELELKYLKECLKIQEKSIGKEHSDFELTLSDIQIVRSKISQNQNK